MEGGALRFGELVVIFEKLWSWLLEKRIEGSHCPHGSKGWIPGRRWNDGKLARVSKSGKSILNDVLGRLRLCSFLVFRSCGGTDFLG